MEGLRVDVIGMFWCEIWAPDIGIAEDLCLMESENVSAERVLSERRDWSK